jgi:hypothetical protein
MGPNNFTALLLAVLLLSAQLTPRIIARAFNDSVTQIALGVFVVTHTYSLIMLGRIENTVPPLSVALAGNGNLGRKVINNLYPRRITDGHTLQPPTDDCRPGDPARVIEHVGAPGVCCL